MANELFKNYGFEVEENRVPVAIALPGEQEAVVGALVRFDGRASVDPEGTGLTFFWTFTQVPIGSQVEKFGFNPLEDDSSIVSFAPDIIGIYKVQLIVWDGSLYSDPTEVVVDVRVILVPHHQGFIPDASFIWNYISDFWRMVEGRKMYETFWSAAIQIVASEILKLYQYDYNKSIRDIQEVIQKRWLYYSPGLTLSRDKCSFILADDQAGSAAATLSTDPTTGLPSLAQADYTNLVTVPKSEGDFETTEFSTAVSVGRVLRLGARSFTLLRANSVTKALSSGADGQTTAGTNDFFGSHFTSDMVGATLRIVTGEGEGDYEITTFVDSGHVQVDLGSTIWVNEPGLEYSVLPAEPNTSAFFADQTQVPGGLDNQVWRLSSTLISEEHDFENEGVSPGDVVEIEITRLDINLHTNIYAQVVSVDRNRLGFVLNLEDLADGVPAGWFTDDMVIGMASDLQVNGVLESTDGSLVFSSESSVIDTRVNSFKFRREYFETELDVESEIDVGAFKISARPVQVIRNSRLPVDDQLVSVPILQEYVKQPDIITDADGKITFVLERGQVEATREPFVLVENLDYIIDDDSTIAGTCNVLAGMDEIEVPHGDLIDRSIQEEDTITIDVGISQQTFSIRRVVAADRLRVFPAPSTEALGAAFTIKRRVGGKFIRFVGSAFLKKKPAPKRLWAEVSYFDNNEAVENNFGVLVGVNREDLSATGVGVPYKSAVAGLMYALVNGPTISNLALSAQILLGLPFTQNAGVITEINPEFRKNEDGSPLFGRILVEARDGNNKPTGLTNIYTYPQGRQLPDPENPGQWISAVPEFSGLAINANTGLPFAVGDAVEQFVPLSKGVQIQDYISTPDWMDRLIAQGNVAAQLQKYHSFQLLVNSDLISSTDIDFTAQFMRRVKAHYTKFTSALLKSVEDEVDVDDILTFGRLLRFYEISGLSLPSATKYDKGDDDETIISVEGQLYVRYLSGEDLETVMDDDVVTSPAGGFINARVDYIEEHDVPFIRPGDLVFIEEGNNKGRYFIDDVVSDTELELDMTGANFETFTPNLAAVPPITQIFSIYRPLKNPIWAGRVSVSTGDGLVETLESVGTTGGIGSAGVAVGDTLVFADLASVNPTPSRIYTILEVNPSLLTPYVVIAPDPIEVTGVYDAWVIREGLMTSGVVTQYAVDSGDFFVNTVAFSPFFEFDDTAGDNDWLNICLIRPGDTITFQGLPHVVLRNEPWLRRVQVYPAPEVTVSGEAITLTQRPGLPSTPVSFDFLDRVPSDYLELTLVVSNASLDTLTTSIGSPDVQSSIGTNFNGSPTPAVGGSVDLIVRPGDQVIFQEGPESTRDIGHGPGIFPIREVLAGGTQLRLVENLAATGNYRYAVRRKIPNEG